MKTDYELIGIAASTCIEAMIAARNHVEYLYCLTLRHNAYNECENIRNYAAMEYWAQYCACQHRLTGWLEGHFDI